MKRKTQWILIFSLFGLAFIGVLLSFRSVAILLLVSIVLSYLLHPLVNGFVLREVPVSIAILICYGMLLMVLSFLFTAIIPLIFRQFQGILSSLPIYYEYVLALWDDYMAKTGLFSVLREFGFDEKIMGYFSKQAEGFADLTLKLMSSIPKALLFSFLVPVVSYYFLRDKDHITESILMIFPPRFRVSVTTIWDEIDHVLKNFIGGSLLISLIVGTLTFLGLFFLGVDYAAALGILYGILDIIPYFGPFLGAVPVILFPVLQGDVNIFFVIILLFLVQQIENYFISPRILGDQVGLHPVSVILLVLIGGYCGGVLGMVLIIPVAAVLKVLLIFFYKKLVATAID